MQDHPVFGMLLFQFDQIFQPADVVHAVASFCREGMRNDLIVPQIHVQGQFVIDTLYMECSHIAHNALKGTVDLHFRQEQIGKDPIRISGLFVLIMLGFALAANDTVSTDGKVHDPQRADFIRRYLSQLARAIKEGIPVLGYQHWALLDNFEWAEGYDPRFGLVYVDYATQERIVKDSAWEYKKIIESNGALH